MSQRDLAAELRGSAHHGPGRAARARAADRGRRHHAPPAASRGAARSSSRCRSPPRSPRASSSRGRRRQPGRDPACVAPPSSTARLCRRRCTGQSHRRLAASDSAAAGGAPRSPRRRPAASRPTARTLALRLAQRDAPSPTASSARCASRRRSAATPRRVHASSEAKVASADLVLKIPRAHVQEAITRLSALGTITSESVDIQDLQAGLNATDRTIARLQKQLADLRAQTPTATTTGAHRRARRRRSSACSAPKRRRAARRTTRRSQLHLDERQAPSSPAQARPRPAARRRRRAHVARDRRGLRARDRHSGRACSRCSSGSRARVRPPAPRGRAAQSFLICAKTRNVGSPTGSSSNSGLTQPSSSERDS